MTLAAEPSTTYQVLADIEGPLRPDIPLGLVGRSRTKKNSLLTLCALILFGASSYTMIMPSLPFYFDELGASKFLFALAVALHGAGQVVGGKFSSTLSDAIPRKTILIACVGSSIFAWLIYATAISAYALLLARFILGVSVGVETQVQRSYICHATSKEDRNVWIGAMSALGIAGFVLGPGLGVVLSRLDFYLGFIHVSQNNAPGYLLALGSSACMLLLVCVFHEVPALPTQAVSDTGSVTFSWVSEAGTEHRQSVLNEIESEQETGVSPSRRRSRRPPNKAVVLFCLSIQVALISGFSVYETVISPLVEEYFEFDMTEVCAMFAGAGVLAVVSYAGVSWLLANVTPRKIMLWTLVVCATGYLMMIDWWTMLKFPWMDYPSSFFLGFYAVTMGFVAGRTTIFSMFALLLGPQHEAQYITYMVRAGYIARILGPFWCVAAFYEAEFDYRLVIVFGVLVVFFFALFLIALGIWDKLVPYNEVAEPDLAPRDEMVTLTGFHTHAQLLLPLERKRHKSIHNLSELSELSSMDDGDLRSQPPASRASLCFEDLPTPESSSSESEDDGGMPRFKFARPPGPQGVAQPHAAAGAPNGNHANAATHNSADAKKVHSTGSKKGRHSRNPSKSEATHKKDHPQQKQQKQQKH
eukprot:GILJ01008893.1.p1 GENE.GILJ01008893.1~~GILJ01008893.1.p1  ORF type:complete len:642 (-),score=53.31 GILJ01008893.1:142-2067(-)